MFSSRYSASHAEIPIAINANKQLNRIIFLRNFYISFAVYAAMLFGCIFSSPSMQRIYLPAGAIAAILAVYILDDFFTVTLFMYLAHIMMASLVFPPRRSRVIAICCVLFFLVFLIHPPFMGLSLGGAEFVRPSFSELFTLTIIMALSSAIMIMLRHCIDTHIYDQETIEHLNSVETRLMLFNHQLQELAKQRGEEAVRQERLRFTRDLHDSCGYAFSNIILASDAAISRNEMGTAHSQEIFHQIRSLASRGLDDTRETLHLIRKIQEPYHKSVETIYQLKKIFEEVTGITVAVELGNIKSDYGPVINKVISRIIQESFTNSIRHGRASRILIQFWEFPGEFAMTVTDNGIGAENIIKGIGLAGMEERLESVGGTLAVSSPQEGGFRLKITIPLVYITRVK
ncbi:MAG: histidine kinase [Treponema sp.]|jgi:signal transduction histidine kinase|nr:histidine kinase [Treponema sp.]